MLHVLSVISKPDKALFGNHLSFAAVSLLEVMETSDSFEFLVFNTYLAFLYKVDIEGFKNF